MPETALRFPALAGKQAAADALLQGKAKYVLLRGGARAGKTYAIIRRILARAIKQPGSRHIIIRKYETDVIGKPWEQTLLPLVREIFGAHAIVRRSPHRVILPNLAEILPGGAAPGELDKVLGGEYDTIFGNEISEFTWHAYSNLMTRLNPTLRDGRRLPGRFFADCNPPSKMHWAYRVFGEGINPGSGKPFDDPELFASMRLTPYDNAEHLAADYISSLESVYTGAARVRFLDGEWGTAQGAIYDEFDPAGDPASGKPGHVGEVKPPPIGARIVVGIDFGYVDPTAIVWTYKDASDRVVVYREYKHSWGRTDQHIRAFIEASLPDCVDERKGATLESLRALPLREQAQAVYRRYTIVGDHDAQYRAQFDAAGVYIQPAQKDILRGIDAVKIRLTRPGGVVVGRNCPALASEFGGYVWDQPRGLDEFKERPKPGDDHALDAFRYVIMETDHPRGARVR